MTRPVTRPVNRPRRRLRTRLALLHAGVAFACSVLLLVMVDLPLVVTGTTTPGPAPGLSTAPASPGNLPEVLRYSAIALIVLAAISVVLGWLIAGRAVRPLRMITSFALTMTAENLNTQAGHLGVPAAYREFADLTETMESLRQRLHESFSAQRQFVANASHELRTPLTVQRTLLQLTLADPDASAGTLRQACGELLDIGQQQEHLLDALLTLATGYRTIDHWVSFDLAGLSHKTVLDNQPEADRRGIRIHAALVPAVVTGDPHLAGSLVSNLVSNAVRHNTAGGTVNVATTPTGRLTVSNTGAVIPPSEIGRLFEPFQRIGTDRTDQTGGHGLGLAIVTAIAQAHSAPISARPQPGGGLRITVDFPRIRPPQTMAPSVRIPRVGN